MVETVGGLLLTMRRTALLGALVVAGALTNVLMLNLSYDVPVKLYSAHLLVMCAFVAAPDFKRMADFFILNRPPSAALRPAIFRNRTLDRIGVAVRTLLFAWLAGSSLWQSYEHRKSWDLAPRGPLHGIWDVEEFTLDGKSLPPLLTDARRWRRVIIQDLGRFSQATIQIMTGPYDQLKAELDPVKRVLRLVKFSGEQTDRLEFHFTLAEPGRLRLDGLRKDQAGKATKIHAELRRFDESKFLLLSRGFHWINEAPFNR